jgi:rsbT co-antagonist protein RsbR
MLAATQFQGSSMPNVDASQLTEVIAEHENSILEEWIAEMATATRRSDLMSDSEVRSQCWQFLTLIRQGTESENFDLESSSWLGARELLGNISRSRAKQGFTPTETAIF